MKYIQSLFIRDDQNPFENSFGWVSPHYHLMGWALSCLTLKKQLGHLSLYCNKRAKELLIDILELPYDEVHESMSGWEPPHPKLWALSKIHTYAQQKTPFLHIDGDVFLFGKFPECILHGSVVAQNVEEFTDYYYSFMKPINRKFTYQPECLVEDFRKMENLHALNAGVLGGCDIDFFQRYCAEAFKYVEANLSNLSEMDADRFNVFFEQHLCYRMAEEENIKVEYLLPQTYHDNSYLGLDMFHEILSGRIKYFHLLGNYKADEFTCQQMAKTLHALYPQYYHRIISLFPELAKEYAGIGYELECEICFIEKKYLLTDSKEEYKTFTWSPDTIYPDTLQDFSEFSESVNTFLKESASFSRSYLNGRDALSFHWYNQIMEKHQPFEISPVIRVIKSSHDWAKLYRGNKTSGIEYYNSTNEVSDKGVYYSLIVSELTPEGFSLFDIDEFEAVVLNSCKSPLSIEELTDRMLMEVDSEVKEKHLEKVKALIFESLKRLILMKAIQPVRKNYTENV